MTGGIKLAKEGVECKVSSSGSDLKTKQTKSPQKKKLFEHARTKSHLVAASLVDKAKEDTQVIVNTQHVKNTLQSESSEQA
jgi:hypothetical protein